MIQAIGAANYDQLFLKTVHILIHIKPIVLENLIGCSYLLQKQIEDIHGRRLRYLKTIALFAGAG